MVQLSHPYMTTGKTIALTIQIFVSKVMFLLFNVQSRLIKAFLPKSKYVLISCQRDGEKMEIVTNFLFLGSKITEIVTPAMKLKHTCSLEGKL